MRAETATGPRSRINIWRPFNHHHSHPPHHHHLLYSNTVSYHWKQMVFPYTLWIKPNTELVVSGKMWRVSIKCKVHISVKCRVLVQASKLMKSSSVWKLVSIGVSLIHGVELKIAWFDYVIWQASWKYTASKVKYKSWVNKPKRRVQKRFPMMCNLKEECKVLISAVKFKCSGWKFKWCHEFGRWSYAIVSRSITWLIFN